MPIVIVNLPSDGTSADVADYNGPINAILAVMNGHLAADNIEPGSLDWSVMSGTMTNVIPSTAMQDSGSAEKFRAESSSSFIASGCIWSSLSGLNATMTSGVSYNANGTRTQVAAIASMAMTPSRDTYFYIQNGVVGKLEVLNDALQPTLPNNSVWVSKIVSSAVAITSVTNIQQTSPYSRSIYYTANNGASRQVCPSNSTTTIVGSRYTYTTGNKPETLFLTFSCLAGCAGVGGLYQLYVNGTTVGYQPYIGIGGAYQNYQLQTIFQAAPNTLYTIEVKAKTQADAITIANSSADIPSGFYSVSTLVANQR